MATAGRKPKPPKLKLVEGNPGKRPIPDAPKPAPRAPEQPDWEQLLPGEFVERVRVDAGGEWLRVVPVLDGLGLLSSIDRGVLADYCMCWARMLECERALSETGLLVYDVSAQGQTVKRNPLSVTVKEYRSALRSYCGELGLSPSARGRLTLPDSHDDDDLFD